MKRNYFGDLHPAVTFVYFCAVLIFSMIQMHPVLLGISFAGAAAYAAALNPRGAGKFFLRFLLPLMLVMTAANPLLNHAGATILLYVNDNPLTLESLLYGAAAAILFAGVLCWFSCLNAVLTADKLIFLFSRSAPALSLMFTMTLRFVPRFRAQVAVIEEAQEGVGRGVKAGNFFARFRNGVRVLSILTTWALENGIVTADSMRARGYGLPGRTSFGIYRFDKRDKVVLFILIGLILAVSVGLFAGEAHVRFFPAFSVRTADPALCAAYALLCAFPLLFQAAAEGMYHGNF